MTSHVARGAPRASRASLRVTSENVDDGGVRVCCSRFFCRTG